MDAVLSRMSPDDLFGAGVTQLLDAHAFAILNTAKL